MEGNQLKEVLARFGHEDFREGQREPIEAVLRGEDAVVVMPTGGKTSSASCTSARRRGSHRSSRCWASRVRTSASA